MCHDNEDLRIVSPSIPTVSFLNAYPEDPFGKDIGVLDVSQPCRTWRHCAIAATRHRHPKVQPGFSDFATPARRLFQIETTITRPSRPWPRQKSSGDIGNQLPGFPRKHVNVGKH